jgi:phage recombination protein Bet
MPITSSDPPSLHSQASLPFQTYPGTSPASTEILRVGDISENTAITIPTAEGYISMSVRDVLQWVAPQAPPAEALRFLLVCRAARVNPFLQEAFLVPMGGKWVIEISKAGWLKRAEDHPMYDGFLAGIIVQNLDNSVRPPAFIGDPIYKEGAVWPRGMALLGGWCEAYRKDRKTPYRNEVSFDEYKGIGPTWTGKPATMIRKVAIVHSLREAGFLTSDTLDSSEIPDRIEPIARNLPPTAAIDAEFREVTLPALSVGIAEELQAAITEVGMTESQVATMLGRRGVGSLVELSDGQAREILFRLRAEIDRKNIGTMFLPDTPTEPAPGPEVADPRTEGPEEDRETATQGAGEQPGQLGQSVEAAELAPDQQVAAEIRSETPANTLSDAPVDSPAPPAPWVATESEPDAELPDVSRPNNPTAVKGRKRKTAGTAAGEITSPITS